jgi:hypothetical protein
MLHFDTPGDRSGGGVLRNLWEYLAAASPAAPAAGWLGPVEGPRVFSPPELLSILTEILSGIEELMAAGERHSLWRWRNPFLLQWRRGVRGLEYSTLSVMLREIRNRLNPSERNSDGDEAFPACVDAGRLRRELLEIRRQLSPFVIRAGQLLERERHYIETGPLSPLHCDDPEIQDLREELFASAMSHGGAFKGLIDAVDRLWLSLIRPAPG